MFVAVVVAFPFNILPARVTLKLIFDRLKAKRRLCLNRGPSVDEDTNSQRTPVSLEIDAGSPIQSSGSLTEPLITDQNPVQNPAEHVLITLLLSGGALIVAIFVPGISIVFGLMGEYLLLYIIAIVYNNGAGIFTYVCSIYFTCRWHCSINNQLHSSRNVCTKDERTKWKHVANWQSICVGRIGDRDSLNRYNSVWYLQQ